MESDVGTKASDGCTMESDIGTIESHISTRELYVGTMKSDACPMESDVAYLEIILRFLAAWLAYQNFLRKILLFQGRKCKIFEESIKYSKKLMENLINYNILQII